MLPEAPTAGTIAVGVVSDTHMPRFGRRLPAALRDGLAAARVELILHLGDLTSLEVVALFEEIAPFDAVAGNNDGDEIRERFGRSKVRDVGGVRIGMVHGDGQRGTTLKRALQTFSADSVDALLFGHSHIPYCEPHGPTWLLNPGSPTDKRRQPSYSYGVLAISDGRVTPRLFFYDDRRT